MESKIMQIFYGNDCLPYKDKERAVHYPIVGSAFQGASQTTEIRFYLDQIGGTDNTWVAVSKLPNGKVGSQILETGFDEEIGENYAYLSLSSFYTQAKGDLYISLQGYDGGVQVQYDDETDLYEVYGTPVIQATGIVKIAINYAIQPVNGDEFNEITVQELIGYISGKLDKNSGKYIKVVDNISNINTSTYEDYLQDGDIVYSINNKKFYKLAGSHPSLTYEEITFRFDDLIITDLEVTGLLKVYSFYEIQDSDHVTLADFIDSRIAYIFVKGTGTIRLTDAQYNLLANNDNVRILYGNKIYTKVEKNVNSGHHDTYQVAGTFVTGLNTTNYELQSYTIYLYHSNKVLGDVTFGYTFYSKDKVDALLDEKADSSELADYYTSDAVDDLLDLKANASDVYPKSDTYNKTEVYTKGETDTAIANAIATVYKPQGTKTVAQLNALTPTSAYNGYVYNVSDDGTLSQGSVSVSAGDNVVLLWDSVNNTWSWDKLASTVDLTPYYTKTEVDTLLGGKVAKSNDTNIIYGRTTTEAVFQVGQGANANKIVQRTSTGQINVPETPTADEHASSKKYVDLGLAGKVSTTRTIAGIDLADDITAQDLTDALVFATNSDIDSLFE